MSDFNDVKIKMNLSIGYSSANQDSEEYLHDYFSEDEWMGMSKDEQENAISEIAKEWSYNYIELSGWVGE